MQKRCLTIQDYSCLGRCSLTVALPVLSAGGIETCGIPTAVLSNHTAGFKDWTFKDLTLEMKPIVEHWLPYKHDFDAIYTGYLATDQIDIVSDIISTLKTKEILVVVDPAFADNGKLYASFKEDHITEMKKLVSKADIILPNLTEACFLTGTDYPSSYDEKLIKKTLVELTSLGPKKAVISGISFKEDVIGCLYYDAETERFGSYMTESYDGVYHGTGDLFASAFVASLLNEKSFEEAVEIAHDIVHISIEKTLEDGKPEIYYGVEFEKALPSLIKRLNLN